MPSDKNIFIPKAIFSVQGTPVLFGTIKSGLLQNGMTVIVDKKILKITKIDGSSSNLGIYLSGIDVTQAQNLINKELEFLGIVT
jgi:hypothetical protein